MPSAIMPIQSIRGLFIWQVRSPQISNVSSSELKPSSSTVIYCTCALRQAQYKLAGRSDRTRQRHAPTRLAQGSGTSAQLILTNTVTPSLYFETSSSEKSQMSSHEEKKREVYSLLQPPKWIQVACS
ncbi:uncharacterized protein RAG0_08350 [Rhynchosporium agropyri]|uniref:Uncharacterized protein n=1 Tax=Rhynchosporium agropyri TaxID=914238 RepID=A0A1E1KTI0_9HELO|nr:uncharacterized protein RAG0_08350 [Rhynchosporium agropyri]